MSILATLKAAGLPVASVTLDGSTTQAEQYSPIGGRNSSEFTTGENTPVYVAVITWDSEPTKEQRDTFRTVVSSTYVLSDDPTVASGSQLEFFVSISGDITSHILLEGGGKILIS